MSSLLTRRRFDFGLATLAVLLLASACQSDRDPAPDEPWTTLTQAAAHEGPWSIPADVRAAGEAQYVAYDSAPAWDGGASCGAGLLPGPRELGDYLEEHFAGACQIQGYNCRPNSGAPSRMSVHGTGRAIDVIVPTVGGSSACFDGGGQADNDLGDAIGNWLIENAESIGVQYIIWDWWKWRGSASGRKDSAYCNLDVSRCHPHHNHLHVELTVAGANRETPWFVDGCGDGSCGNPGDPELTCEPEAVTGAEDEVFKDLAPSSFGYEAANVLWRAGITNGCRSEPRMYCPSCAINRYAMVVFLLRAAEIDPGTPPERPTFDDVPADRWYYPHVERAAALGITTGCGDGSFCPLDPVTRGQAAAFISRTQGWPLLNPATPSFGDVPTDHLFYRSIETISAWCITNGCGGGDYCPEAELTRAQAAIFIARAFDLENSNTCVELCDPAGCETSSWCEPWTDCDYADSCDEQAVQTRNCHEFACEGTQMVQICTETVGGETNACARDTSDALECAPDGLSDVGDGLDAGPPDLVDAQDGDGPADDPLHSDSTGSSDSPDDDPVAPPDLTVSDRPDGAVTPSQNEARVEAGCGCALTPEQPAAIGPYASLVALALAALRRRRHHLRDLAR